MDRSLIKNEVFFSKISHWPVAILKNPNIHILKTKNEWSSRTSIWWEARIDPLMVPQEGEYSLLYFEFFLKNYQHTFQSISSVTNSDCSVMISNASRLQSMICWVGTSVSHSKECAWQEACIGPGNIIYYLYLLSSQIGTNIWTLTNCDPHWIQIRMCFKNEQKTLVTGQYGMSFQGWRENIMVINLNCFHSTYSSVLTANL